VVEGRGWKHGSSERREKSASGGEARMRLCGCGLEGQRLKER